MTVSLNPCVCSHVLTESINIKINIHTLKNFFEEWAAEATREDSDDNLVDEDLFGNAGTAHVHRKQQDATVLNYNEFIAKILPAVRALYPHAPEHADMQTCASDEPVSSTVMRS